MAKCVLTERVYQRQTALKKIRSSVGYYVYVLWRHKDGAWQPFYVGKGKGQRLHKHWYPSDKANVLKSRIFAKEEREGRDIRVSLHAHNVFEAVALETEKSLIRQIGRLETGDGPLVNRTDGGDGLLGYHAPRRGKSGSAKPIVADGKSYDCAADAAEALGITRGALSVRVRRGWPGYYYPSEGQRPQHTGIRQHWKRAVVANGEQYDSLSAAARALGLSVGCVYDRINYGVEGYYYLAEGQKPRQSKRQWKAGAVA